MSFLKHISDIFHSIIGAVAHIFSQENIEKAEQVAKPISDLLVYASPYVELIAHATPTTLDDKLVAIAEKVNVNLQSVLRETDPAVRKGRILTFVGDAVKEDIKGLVVAGGHGIDIGPWHIAVSDDLPKIPSDLFDSAAQLAYSLFVKSRPVELQA